MSYPTTHEQKKKQFPSRSLPFQLAVQRIDQNYSDIFLGLSQLVQWMPSSDAHLVCFPDPLVKISDPLLAHGNSVHN